MISQRPSIYVYVQYWDEYSKSWPKTLDTNMSKKSKKGQKYFEKIIFALPFVHCASHWKLWQTSFIVSLLRVENEISQGFVWELRMILRVIMKYLRVEMENETQFFPQIDEDELKV